MASKGEGGGGGGASYEDTGIDDYPTYLNSVATDTNPARAERWNNPSTTVEVDGETIDLTPVSRYMTKGEIDMGLEQVLTVDVQRNRFNPEQMGRIEGLNYPRDRLHQLYDAEYLPYQHAFKSYAQFERYYQQNVQQHVEQNLQDMYQYLRDHPSRDRVTAYGWLGDGYEDR